MWDALQSLTVGDAAGEQHRFVHSWPWPHWTTLLILIVAAVAILSIYAHERTTWRTTARLALGLLRWMLIAMVVVVMMYGWNLIKDITELPDLIVAVDESASMLHEDAAAESSLREIVERAGFDAPSRWNLARALLVDPRRPLLEQLSKRYHVKLFRIGESVRAETSEQLSEAVSDWTIDAEKQQHRASRLGKAVRDLLDAQRGRPTAAVVVLTDGITTEGETIRDVAAHARRLNIPLHLVAVGDERPVRDLRIADLLADDVVFVGDVAQFDFRLSANGYAGQEVKLRIVRLDRQEVVAEQTLTVPRDNSPQSVRLSFRPEEVGEMELRVEAVAASDDINPDNNHLTHRLSVRDDLIRVLLVQEQPSFEYRTLKALLERGTQRGDQSDRKAVELHVVLQEADLEYATIDASARRSFPVDRNELFQFDVIIIGDANPAFFSRSLLENLSDFVTERGGGLVLLSGPRHMPWAYRGTPLADIMPVVADEVRPPSDQELLSESYSAAVTAQGASSPLVQLTDEAGSSAQQWLKFPPVYWLAKADELRLGARVLVEAQSDNGAFPLVCLQFVGAGKVVMVLTDESYRWARHPAGEAYYARFWLQTIRYLSRSKLLGGNRLIEFTTNKESFQRGEPVQLKVRFLDDRLAPGRDDGVTVILEHEGGRRRSVNLVRDGVHRGVFQADAIDLAEGEYRAWMATPNVEGDPPSLNFPVKAQRGELARLELNAAELREAAEQSDGEYYTALSAKSLARNLPPGRQVRVQSLPPRPLWNAPIWALLFIAIITTEWLLRKRAGML